MAKMAPLPRKSRSNRPPRADEKAYRSALDRLPEQKFDPWRNVR
jgi:hypothetical protein